MSEEIIKAAILGTDKYMPQVDSDLLDLAQRLSDKDSEKESYFLKLAATTFLYEEAGRSPIEITEEISKPEVDTLKVLDAQSNALIQSLIKSKDEVLFNYIMQFCYENNYIVGSALVPFILNKALEKKANDYLVKVCGATGKWLCSLNESWKELTSGIVEENIWETGNIEQRKKWWAEFRTSKPSEALQLFENTLSQENANVRAEFLALMKTNLSLEDEPYLLTLLKDKSQKVKNIALAYLKVMNGSSINLLYFNYIISVLTISKNLLQIRTINIDKEAIPSEEIFKTGIEKISSEKGIDDYIFWFYQILAFTDPAKLAKHYQLSEKELIELLLSQKKHKLFLPYLVHCAINHQNQDWAVVLLNHKSVLELDLLYALKPEERLGFLEKFITENIEGTLHFIMNGEYTTIPNSIGEKILAHLEKNPYRISTVMSQQLALLLDISLMSTLKKYINADKNDYQYIYFKNHLMEMIRVIETKENFIKKYNQK